MGLVVLEEPPLLLFAPQAAKTNDKNSATLSKKKLNFVDIRTITPHFPL
jgi:hypothetical protein